MILSRNISNLIVLLLMSIAFLTGGCESKTGAGQSGNPGVKPVKDDETADIMDAIDRRIVHVKILGDREKKVKFQLESIIGKSISLKLEPGFYAKSVDYGISHDKLLVGSDIFKLEADQKIMKTMQAYSMSHRPLPPEDREIEYKLQRLPGNSAAEKLAIYLDKNPDTNQRTTQAAVWAAAEKMFFEDIKNLLIPGTDIHYISGKDFHEAMEMLRKAGVKPENLRTGLDVEREILNASERVKHGNKTECIEAIEYLGWFHKMDKPASVLIEIMEENDDPRLRQKAAEALANSWLKKSIEALLLTLELDSSRSVRRAAAFSLTLSEQVGAIPFAIMFLADKDADDSIKAEIRRKLSEITGVDKLDWDAKDWEIWWLSGGGWKWLEARGSDVGRMKDIMEAQHRFYRDPAIEATSDMDSGDLDVVLDWLRKLHTTEGRENLRDEEVFERVIELAEVTKNASVALNIAWILRGIEEENRRQKGSKALLLMLSKKENRAAYRDIISVLEQWKVEESVEPLIYMLDDKQYGEIAAEALKNITGRDIDSSDRKAWRELLEEHGSGIREKFINRLKNSSGEELTQVLSDLSSSMYRKLWTDEAVFEALLTATTKIENWEQVNAATYLIVKNKKEPAAQKSLLKMASRLEDLESKRVVIEVLAQDFPNGSTVEFLLELLDTGRSRLKIAARKALYDITGASSARRLKTKSDWLEYFAKHPSARWGKEKE